MPVPASPQFRFLLRGSSLLLAMLALWWFVLLYPLLAGIRLSTDLFLRILPGGSTAASVTRNPQGDWILQVPIPASLAKQDSMQRAYGRAPGAPLVKVRSFKLAIAERIPTFFTLSFPLFWALVLAAPRTPRLWRVVAGGTALLAILALLSMLFYTAFTIETNLRLLSSNLANILWSAAEYLNINLVPYLAPLLLALWLHGELRAQIFSWDVAAAPVPSPVTPAVGDKPRRGRHRGR